MFDFFEKNEIKYLSFIDNDKILAGVTTRTGGSSSHCYSSLNMGTNTKDPISNILNNRNKFLQLFESNYNLFSLKQTHSNTIIDLDSTFESDLEGDGFITTQKNMMITVTVADCGNIVITDTSNSIIGVFHAGWRGLENEILKKGLTIMKEKLKELFPQQDDFNLEAYVGPMITSKNYEVGEEFYNYFNKKYLIKRDEKTYLKTEDVVHDTLTDNGVSTIHSCKLDTFEEKELFFSYRRDGETGRIMNFVVLK